MHCVRRDLDPKAQVPHGDSYGHHQIWVLEKSLPTPQNFYTNSHSPNRKPVSDYGWARSQNKRQDRQLIKNVCHIPFLEVSPAAPWGLPPLSCLTTDTKPSENHCRASGWNGKEQRDGKQLSGPSHLHALPTPGSGILNALTCWPSCLTSGLSSILPGTAPVLYLLEVHLHLCLMEFSSFKNIFVCYCLEAFR